MTNQTVDLNENLVKIDNLLKGLEYLYEEISTRKTEIATYENVMDIVKTQMSSASFYSELIYNIRYNYGNTLARDVSYHVMDSIDKDIDQFINTRVDQALRKAGVPVKGDTHQ